MKSLSQLTVEDVFVSSNKDLTAEFAHFVHLNVKKIKINEIWHMMM